MSNPSRQMAAGLLCVGNELLDGTVVDTHTAFLGRVLRQCGLTLSESLTVGDDEAYADRIRSMAARLPYLLVTGGLGPTSDDRTRSEISSAAETTLEFVPELWEQIQKTYPAARAASNRRQADVPQGFEPLENTVGTAPGLVGQIGDCTVFVLPGPPAELTAMVEREVVPRLSGGSVSDDELRATVFGIPEAELEDVLAEVDDATRWSTVAGGSRILLTLRGSGASAALQRLRDRYGAVRVVDGRVAPGEGLLRAAAELGAKLVFAESCTGGAAGALVTAIPGSSASFWGSLVSYDNEAKRSLLSVEAEILDRFGAVSAECAAAMARGAADKAERSAALSITGIAGPEGGSAEKPVGTVWIGVAWEGRVETTRHQFRGNRDRIRREAALTAVLALESFMRDLSLDRGTG